MRRSAAALVAALLVLLTACGAPHLTPPPPSKVDVTTPEMVALKQKTQLPDCPGSQGGGGALPSLTLDCLGGGRSVDLSTLRGPLVINFWQSACVECQKEMPALEAFYKEYGEKIPVLGVDITDTLPGVALKQAAKRGITYPIVADPGGDTQETKLHIQGTPAFWLLAADGTLSYHVGGLTSEAEVKALVEDKLGITL